MGLSFGLGLPAAPKKGVGVSLIPFMAGQSDGFWYDFSKTDRLFQENVGPTPAATANVVIGLALSQRLWAGQTLAQVVASQTPTLQDDFSSYADTAAMVAAGWDKRAATSGTVTLSSGAFQFTSAAAGLSSGAGKLVSGFTVGRCYQLTGRIRMVSGGGSVSLGLRNSDGGGGSSMVIAAPSVAGTSFEQVTAYWVATQTTAHVALIPSVAAATAELDDIRISDVSRYPATQSAAGFKPKYQTTGAVFDASDDNLLTSYVAQNGANFIVAYLDVPASIPATQVVAGASGSSANRCFLAFNTSGQLCAGVGSQSTTTVVGTTDWRGQTVVVGLSLDGSTVKLFAGSAEEYTAAQAGTPTTSIPFRVGALNNNGTAGSFSGVAMKRLLVGRQALTLTQFNSIRSQLLAGA